MNLHLITYQHDETNFNLHRWYGRYFFGVLMIRLTVGTFDYFSEHFSVRFLADSGIVWNNYAEKLNYSTKLNRKYSILILLYCQFPKSSLSYNIVKNNAQIMSEILVISWSEKYVKKMSATSGKWFEYR